MTSGLAILFDVECPQGSHCAPGEFWHQVQRLVVIMPQGNSTFPVECEISSPVDCPYCSMLSALGKVYSLCAPGELSFTSWLWNTYDQWTSHIVRCWVPPGKSVVIVPRGNFVTKFNGQSSLCPRGTQHLQLNVKYHHQWTVHIVQCWVPSGKSTLIVAQANSVSPVGYEILMTSGLAILFDVECPRGSLLSLLPKGAQYRKLAMKYHDQWTGHIVQCWVPWGKSVVIVPRGNFVTKFKGQSSLCARKIILFNVECPRRSQLSLCPRGTQDHQLAMK